MSDSTVIDALQNVKFFHGIPQKNLLRLSEIAKCLEYPARTDIFREHDKAEDVYFIISGKVSLKISEPKAGVRQLMELGDGDLIGWSPLVGRHLLSDTAHTVTPVKAVAANGEKLLDLCRKDPEFGFEFMRRALIALSERLSATRLQLLKVAGVQVYNGHIESD